VQRKQPRSVSFSADALPEPRQLPVRCASLFDNVPNRAAAADATLPPPATANDTAASAGGSGPNLGGPKPLLLRTQSAVNLRARRLSMAVGDADGAGRSFFFVD
jgi:hypothetical protein